MFKRACLLKTQMVSFRTYKNNQCVTKSRTKKLMFYLSFQNVNVELAIKSDYYS